MADWQLVFLSVLFFCNCSSSIKDSAGYIDLDLMRSADRFDRIVAAFYLIGRRSQWSIFFCYQSLNYLLACFLPVTPVIKVKQHYPAIQQRTEQQDAEKFSR